MKKVNFLTFFVLCFSLMILSQSITVIKPNAGTVWTIGKEPTINWSKSGQMDAYVKINIFRNSILQSNFVEQLVNPNSGTMKWKIKKNYTPGVYQLRIKTFDNKVIGDSAKFRLEHEKPKMLQMTQGNTKFPDFLIDLDQTYCIGGMGRMVVLHFWVKNAGERDSDGGADSFVVLFGMADHRGLFRGYTRSITVSNSLKIGESAPFKISFKNASAAVYIFVDGKNEVAETNENNNRIKYWFNSCR